MARELPSLERFPSPYFFEDLELQTGDAVGCFVLLHYVGQVGIIGGIIVHKRTSHLMKGCVGELDEEYSLSSRSINGHPAFRISLRYIDQLGIIAQCDGVYKRLLMLFAFDVVAHRPFVLQAVCQSLILVVGDKGEVVIFDTRYLFGYHVDISVEACHCQRHVSRVVV